MNSTGEEASVRRRLACWCVLLATPSFVFCGLHHVCVCGHMAHGIWPRLHYVNDAFWIIAYALAMVVAVRSDIRRRLLFVVCAALSLLLRFAGPELLDLAPALVAVYVAGCELLRPLDRAQASPAEDGRTPDYPN